MEETPKTPLFNPFSPKPGDRMGDKIYVNAPDPEKLIYFKPRQKRFHSLDDLTHLPEPSWAIEGMFEANSLVMLAGPPASYKSFLGLSWLLSMASGRPWCGRKVQQAKVLYVLGEGKSSLLKRCQAWLHWQKLEKSELALLRENFRVSFEVPQMAQKGSVDNMLAELETEGYKPNVVAIDTFARSFVGLDENSQKDTGLWIEAAERLRHLGYTVIFLHHTKKNAEFGLQYRGSTAIMGAMDTAMVMDANKKKGVATLTVVKQKDHDEGSPLYFNRTIVTPPGSGTGSIVLVPTILMDERYSEDGQNHEKMLDQIMVDESFDSDRARGRMFAAKTGMNSNTAQTRVYRKRQEMDGLIQTADSPDSTDENP